MDQVRADHPQTSRILQRTRSDSGHEHDHDHDHGSSGGGKGHGHHHSHAHVTPTSSRPHLWGALIMLVVFAIGEVIVAVWTNSLALLTDAAHMLSDIGALALALWALRIAVRPANNRMTYGWRRAEILSAAANGATLVGLGALLGYEAVRRFFEPPEVDGGPVLVVALVGVAVNLAATLLLSRANRSSLNVEGAYQHILTDLFAFIGTAMAAIVIITTGWVQADAVASFIVCLIMLRSGWKLLKDSGLIMLQATPEGYDPDEIRQHLLTVEDVLEVHDLHVWQVSNDLPSVSAHIVIEDSCFRTGHAEEVLKAVRDCLHQHFEVAHTTFQLEPLRLTEHTLVH